MHRLEFCRVVNGVNDRVDKNIIQWFGHTEIIRNDRTAKRVYVGVCVGIHLVGQPAKRWIDSVSDCLKTRSLNVGQSRRMMYDRREWWRIFQI